MAEFKSFEPGVVVRGEVLQAFIAGFPQEFKASGLRVLEKHGVPLPNAGESYPLQKLLDAMKEISETFSGQMLTRVGEQIALHAVLPPGIDDLLKCLASIDVAYHMNHSGGEIGRYEFKSLGVETGLHRATLICANPYPCAFDRGVIEGFAKRFQEPGTYEVIVRHDDDQPCRRSGHESCTFVISWV